MHRSRRINWKTVIYAKLGARKIKLGKGKRNRLKIEVGLKNIKACRKESIGCRYGGV